MQSVELVGEPKAVGYLPLDTVTGVLGESLSDFLDRFSKRGLEVRIFKKHETCIKGGAFVVYDRGMVSDMMLKHMGFIEETKFATTPDQLVGNIFLKWFEKMNQSCRL